MTKPKPWPKRRRRDETCINGHLLTDPDNVYVREYDGFLICRSCRRDTVRRARQRRKERGLPGSPPRSIRVPRRRSEDEMTPAEVERALQAGLAEEVAMPWEKPARKRMWPPEADVNRQR